MGIKDTQEKAEEFVKEKGKLAKRAIKEIAEDAEPIIRKAREEILLASGKVEEKAKEFYKKMKLKRK